jgi:hypothetical protein
MYSNPTFSYQDVVLIASHFTDSNIETYSDDRVGIRSLFAIIRRTYSMTNYASRKLLVQIKKHFVENKYLYVNKHICDQREETEFVFDIYKINNDFGTQIAIGSDNRVRYQLLSQSLKSDIDNALYYQALDMAHKAQYILNYKNKLAFFSNSNRHYTITNGGEMKFTPKHKMTHTNDDNHWVNNKVRQTVKYGKGLKQIFQHDTLILSDRFYEQLGNVLKSKYMFDATIEIVKGEDIRKWYLGKNYGLTNTESLGSSCMRHSYCQDYMDIYVENDNVSMIIAKTTDDLIIGRALLWKCDNDELFCDRIYGNGITIENIKKYAQKQGYFVKHKQSYSDNSVLTTTGEIITPTFEVTLNRPSSNLYPYMDTMKYTNDDLEDDKYITLNTEEGDYTLDSTDGGPFNDEEYITLHNGNRARRDDCIYVEGEDEWYYSADTVYSDFYNEYLHIDNAIEDYDGRWISDNDDDFSRAEDTDQVHHVDDLVYSEHDGNYYYTDYEDCPIHGIISTDNSQDIEYNGQSITCHTSVTVAFLIEQGIIEEEVTVE